MLAKIGKNPIAIYSLCFIFFVLAGIFQYFDENLPMLLAKIVNLCANLIFFLLVFIWGYTINNRIVKKSIKIKLLIIVALIILWLLIRYIKYECFFDNEIASRYLWYLYYIPQCLVPCIALIAVLEFRKNAYSKVNKCIYVIFVPSIILIGLILTNDLHQLAFSFNESFENFSSDYTHGIVYFLTMSWIILLILSMLIILFFICSVSSCKRRIWIPIIFFIFSLLVSFLCYFFVTQSYKVPELISFSFIILMESCIYIGLVPSNRNYEKYFAVSNLSSIIVDKNIRPIFNTNKKIVPTKCQFENAKINESIFINKNTRLSCKRISGGYVFYLEDFSSVNKLVDELMSINEELKKKNELIINENRIKEKKTKIEQQNYLYSQIFEICADAIESINIILKNVDENDKAYKKNLHIACIFLAYIKRRSNLQIILSQNDNVNISEINLSIKESLNYLSDCGIQTSFITAPDKKINTEIAILLYDFFHECIKNGLPTISELLVKISFYQNILYIRVVSSNASSDVSNFTNKLFDKINASIDIKKEEECLYQTLTIKLRGNE